MQSTIENTGAVIKLALVYKKTKREKQHCKGKGVTVGEGEAMPCSLLQLPVLPAEVFLR